MRHNGGRLLKKLQSPNLTSLKQFTSPFPPSVHHTLPMFDSKITVYEDEPSSIIAYTLSSSAHAQFIVSKQIKDIGRRKVFQFLFLIFSF